MKAFAELYEALDSTTSTNAKVEAMCAYLQTASAEDAAWAVFFLSGQRLKRFISSRTLTLWFLASRSIAEWLFKECYMAVGDTAETIALLNDVFRPKPSQNLLPSPEMNTRPDLSLSQWMTEEIQVLNQLQEPEQQAAVLRWWDELPMREVFMVNKLLSGAFRVGVSQRLLIRALAEVSGLEPSKIAHRLMGHWEPTAAFYQNLIAEGESETDHSKPYPFFLAYPLDEAPEKLGPVSDWLLEWKWDGIRGQCIHRGQEVFFWSRGEELMQGRFPELEAAAQRLPDGVVLDGEVLAYQHGAPLPFSALQTRIGRKKLTPKVLAEAPVVFMAYDLLEAQGEDIRHWPLKERRAKLETLIEAVGAPFLLSPALQPKDWQEAHQIRQEARQRGVEGFLLKRLDSSYQSGRKRGDWWKWKVDPLTIDAVLIYAQAGTGRRANLFTDYTFAVWNEGVLVPVAKAYSGLSNQEIEQLDRWIRANTQEKFGPVRSVKPLHVFELGFEGINESKRHKSGVALRFPRILRWRQDKPMEEADTLETLKALLHVPLA